jgi:hypothetical protein
MIRHFLVLLFSILCLTGSLFSQSPIQRIIDAHGGSSVFRKDLRFEVSGNLETPLVSSHPESLDRQ